MKKSEFLKSEVLILGGGPSGMIAAIYLSKLGIKNILVERRSEIQAHPKAHELSARSIEIISSLGIPVEEFLKEASDHETASKILFCNTINDEIGRIDLAESSIKKKYDKHLSCITPYINISQTEFERVLRRYLLRAKFTTTLLNHQWESSREENGFVHSQILYRTTNEKITISSNYLICADGAGSRSRGHFGIKMSGLDKIQDIVNVYFTNDLTPYIKTKAKLYWIFNPHAPGVFIAHHPAKRWVYHHQIETPYEKVGDFDEAYFQEKLRIALGLPEDFKYDIKSISNWRMTSQVAEKFRSGNAFLVGDAAHRFPPTGGLGMNSGIGDAQNLCWKLKTVLRNHASDALLDTYESERRPVIERNCLESMKNWINMMEVPLLLGLDASYLRIFVMWLHKAPLKWVPAPLKKKLDTALRNLGERRLFRSRQNPTILSAVKLAIARQTKHFDRIGLDLGFSYKQEERPVTPINNLNIDVNEYVPSTQEGVRFPHFWLNEKKSKISSHSLLSVTDFTLLIDKENKLKNVWKKILEDKSNSLPIKIVYLDRKKFPKAEAAEIDKLLDMEVSGAILVRPDGHVCWKAAALQNEKQIRDLFFNVVKGIISPTINRNIIKNELTTSKKKGKLNMVIFAIILSLLLFTFYLFRPLSHIPSPANFQAYDLAQGKFSKLHPKPARIYGMGLVYSKHIIETAADFDPKVPPPIFLKDISSLTQNGSNVNLPNEDALVTAILNFEPALEEKIKASGLKLNSLLDYEVELGFVLLEDISTTEIKNENFAPRLGFFVANDLSARSLAVFGEGMKNKADYWGISKSFKGFLPVSDKIWTPDLFLPNGIPDVLLETYVNGELRQRESTTNMIYTPREMLKFIAEKYPDYPLKKGDVVITGTPGGVAMATPKAMARLADLFHLDRFTKLKMVLKKDRSKFLKSGDEVLVKGIGLGEIKNKIVIK